MRLKQYKTARRLGARIFSKTENPKFSLAKKQVVRKHQSPMTEFGLQLIEKQKMRYSYNLNEHQFGKYVRRATIRKGNTAEYLFKDLESRLDNVVYRLGFAKTRPLARQAVSHGHITVNGRRVNIPSFQVKEGDVIGIKEGSKASKLFSGLGETLKGHTSPGWLTVDPEKVQGKVIGVPKPDERVGELFNIASVIGFYTR